MSKFLEVISDNKIFVGQLFHVTIDEHVQVIELVNCVQIINNDIKYKDSFLALCYNSTIYKYYEHKIVLNVAGVKDIDFIMFDKILAKAKIECLYM